MYVKSPFTEKPTISPAEKRTLERHHLLYYLRVWDIDGDCLIGHLADVSTEGLMVVGEKKLESDKLYKLRMLLPSGAGEADPLEFNATTCWSSNDVNKMFYDTGFQFSDISPDTLGRIKNLIQEYGLSG